MIHNEDELIRRFRTANSPETAPEVLKDLALDENEIVRGSLAYNTATPLSAIEVLFNDSSDYVIDALRVNGYPVDPIITQAKKVIGKNIVLRNANENDADFIVSLRTDEKKGRFISTTSDDPDKQRLWLKNYQLSTGQAYFIIEDKTGNKLGTIRMYDQKDNSFCWGSWLIIDSAPGQTAIESALLLYSYALKIGFKKAHFDVRKDNSSVRKFHERFGAKTVDKNNIDVFYEITKEQIIESMRKYNKYLPGKIDIIL